MGMRGSADAQNSREAKRKPRRHTYVVCVSGSRGWTRAREVYDRLDWAMARHPYSGFKVISGGATGVDSFARTWCLWRGIDYEEFLPDWSKGRGAGHARNREMLDQKPDFVLCFWDGSSPGTRGMIEECRRRGQQYAVILPAGSPIRASGRS